MTYRLFSVDADGARQLVACHDDYDEAVAAAVVGHAPEAERLLEEVECRGSVAVAQHRADVGSCGLTHGVEATAPRRRRLVRMGGTRQEPGRRARGSRGSCGPGRSSRS